MAKTGHAGAELLSRRVFFSLDGSARKIAIVHSQLQLWNEVTEASAGFQESEVLPAEARSALTYSRSAQASVCYRGLTLRASVCYRGLNVKQVLF